MQTRDQRHKTLEEKLGRGRIKVNEPLSLHTTFKIGGPADFFYEANSPAELEKAVTLAKELSLSYCVLGGGSNILVSDEGFRGLVIKNKSYGIKILSFKGKIKNQHSEIEEVLVEVDSGVPFNRLVRFTLEEGLDGLAEFLGLPGTVGGAVAVGAHWSNKRVPDLVVSQKKIDKTIISVVFKLKKADPQSLWQVARESIDRRQKKHPQKMFSAGCIFQNIKKSDAARLGTPKLTCSAGFLVEAAGLKGRKINEIQVSPMHANFIVNLGQGKAIDVIELIRVIKEKIKEKFGVELKEEIVKIGEFESE